MSKKTMARAQEGFRAWQSGDFATIEAMFDPMVEWRWFEPGDWDCHSRKDVMNRLRRVGDYERAEPASQTDAYRQYRLGDGAAGPSKHAQRWITSLAAMR